MLLDPKYLCCDFVLPVGEIPQYAVCRINPISTRIYIRSPHKGKVVPVLKHFAVKAYDSMCKKSDTNQKVIY